MTLNLIQNKMFNLIIIIFFYYLCIFDLFYLSRACRFVS